MTKALEYCRQCYEPTGKAGKGEDSLYTDSAELGPYCNECWDDPEFWRRFTDDTMVELAKCRMHSGSN